MNNSDEFDKLLLENNEEEIKKYIVSYGKKPKVTCPICFYDKEYLKQITEEKNEDL